MDPLVMVMVAWVSLYPAAVIVLVLGIRRLRPSRAIGDASAPSVTVLVSARNEAADLPRCLDALLALDYPREKLQIVLVDDLSTDETGALVDAAARTHPHVVAVHTAAQPGNGLEAKARGIAHGFAHATGEWVLITDADAEVPRTWVRHLMGEAGDDVVIVGGSVVVEPRHWWGLAERVANLFLHPINQGIAGWGVPVVAIGPNMGVRRSAYLRAGGLESAPHRVAEDLSLYLMATNGGGRSRLYLDPATTAVLTPVPTPMHFVSQMRRFTGGGIGQDWRYALGLTAVLLWGTGVLACVFAGWVVAPRPWLGIVAAKLAADALLLGVQAKRAGQSLRLHEPFVLQLVHAVIVPIVTFTVPFGVRLHWRGEGYDVRFD